MALQNKRASLSQRLQQAVQAHQQGQLDQAALYYAAILKTEPNHFDAMHLLGVARLQQDRNAEGLDKIQAALRLKPASVEALLNLGLVLRKLGRLEEAVASYDKALALRPDFVYALCNRGVTLQDLKRPEEALASYDKALAIRPTAGEALCNRGIALNNRGIALQDLKRPEEALACYDKALAISPDYAEALNNRGNALQDLRRPEEALASYDKALAIRPDYAEALNNRGNALRDLMRPEEALACYYKAIAISPDYAEAHNGLGAALQDLKRPEEAQAWYDKAIAIRPDFAGAHFSRGANALSMGDFLAGWRGYEYRWDLKDAEARRLLAPFPYWKGEDIGGRRIIVYEEQGLGDIIQVSRFLTQLVALNAEVTFLLRPSMHRLMRPLSRSVRLVATPPEDETFDFQCALMSLPGAFGANSENVPSNVPYLFAEEAVVARWRERLGDHGLKIGICWQGNPGAKIDIGRSFPLRCFQPLAAMPGVRLISLQKAHGLDQLENLPSGMKVETLGEEFDAGPDAFIDTAAVMSVLDLVITSDTSVAHLAGALGRPVWVVLKHAPDWRWMLDRSDSPWYPTMRLYRQTIRDDWESVFHQIAADVARLKPARTSSPTALVQIPGSIGELFDKITILEIKSARIKDSGKLQNVRHELELLLALKAKYGLSNDDQASLVAELKSVNEALWEIEDDIRDCERRQDFGENFISLARSVYKTNDRRAEIKKELNVLHGSSIVEEKSYGDSCPSA